MKESDVKGGGGGDGFPPERVLEISAWIGLRYEMIYSNDTEVYYIKDAIFGISSSIQKKKKHVMSIG